MFLFPHRAREASVAHQELKETEYVALLTFNSTPSLSQCFSTLFGACYDSPWMIYCKQLFSFQGSWGDGRAKRKPWTSGKIHLSFYHPDADDALLRGRFYGREWRLQPRPRRFNMWTHFATSWLDHRFTSDVFFAIPQPVTVTHVSGFAWSTWRYGNWRANGEKSECSSILKLLFNRFSSLPRFDSSLLFIHICGFFLLP